MLTRKTRLSLKMDIKNLKSTTESLPILLLVFIYYYFKEVATNTHPCG
jgi:hypothetical protein